MLSRVVNALGEPVDGKGELVGIELRRMEIQAPGIMGRQPYEFYSSHETRRTRGTDNPPSGKLILLLGDS